MVGPQISWTGKVGHSPPPTTTHGALLSSILFDRAASSKTAVVCADRGVSLSCAEAALIATDLAAALRQKSIEPRDLVAILLPTSIEFVAAFFGALRADAVVMPLDIHLKRADLLNIIRMTRPRVLMTNAGLCRKIGSKLGATTVCLVEFGGSGPEFDSSISVSFPEPDPAAGRGPGGKDRAEPARTSLLVRPTSPEDDAVFILSSGSTGLPKVVRLSHRAILQNIRMHWESLEIDEDIRGLQLLPLNYSYGLIASFLSILQSGGTVVLLSTAEPRSVLAALEKYEVNLLMGTPALFQYLIEKSPVVSALGASPVRYLTVGGDRCKRYALDLIRDRLPAARVYLTYGLTEAGPRVSTLPPQWVSRFPQSVGFPLKGVEVFIQDSSGRRRGLDEPGEIVLKTPSLMNGYLGDPERTRTVIRNGLCHTGDLGYLDDRGILYCLGRKDRQFKFGGRLVNPALIEQCLSAHPQVQEVAVMKIDKEREEMICARVKAGNVRRDELLPELKRLCRKHMPSYLIPGEFRFEDHDNYYHKGKILDPNREPLPEETVGSQL